MAKKRKKAAYAVKRGRQTGIYSTWDECRAQVDGYSGAQFKGFGTVAEAQAYLGGGARPSPSAAAAAPLFAGPSGAVRVGISAGVGASRGTPGVSFLGGGGNNVATATASAGATDPITYAPAFGAPGPASGRVPPANPYGTSTFRRGGGSTSFASAPGRAASAATARVDAPSWSAPSSEVGRYQFNDDGNDSRGERGDDDVVRVVGRSLSNHNKRSSGGNGGEDDTTSSRKKRPVPMPGFVPASSSLSSIGAGTERGSSGNSRSSFDERTAAAAQQQEPQYSAASRAMMAKMGHVDGRGLGSARHQGIASPVKANGTGQSGAGIGYGREKLNEKQQEAVDLVKRGENVFITGPAGTGKSLALTHIIRMLKVKYERKRWVVVAPTGTAAVALGGQTIHSFAGVGVPRIQEDFQKVWSKRKEWRRLEAMVVDEVSMISGEFFDGLSDVVSDVRNDPRPFGGIQLILCGDFLQLPPIPESQYKIREAIKAQATKTKTSEAEIAREIFQNRGFAFQANTWRRASLNVVQLDQVFRQRDGGFVTILHEMRKGLVSAEGQALLRSCNRPLPPTPFGVKPTVLYATNKSVDGDNSAELRKLPGDATVYKAEDRVEPDFDAPRNAEEKLWRNSFFKDCIARVELELKEGAQVMLVKNEPAHGTRDKRRPRLVNGSRGVVVGFAETISEDELDLSDDEFGCSDEDLEVEKEKPAFDDKDAETSPTANGAKTLYPVVRFANNVKKTIGPETFESEIVGVGKCIRTAVPLRLAWAITAHKSQGMTLDYVIADLAGTFSESQAYVALSRASDQNGLEVRNFRPSHVRSNQIALSFYESPDASFPHWDPR